MVVEVDEDVAIPHRALHTAERVVVLARIPRPRPSAARRSAGRRGHRSSRDTDTGCCRLSDAGPRIAEPRAAMTADVVERADARRRRRRARTLALPTSRRTKRRARRCRRRARAAIHIARRSAPSPPQTTPGRCSRPPAASSARWCSLRFHDTSHRTRAFVSRPTLCLTRPTCSHPPSGASWAAGISRPSASTR